MAVSRHSTLGSDAAGLAALLDLMGQSFDGGTDVQGPVERAIERVHQARWASADLLIGAVLTPGDRAPTLVNEALVQQMRPGSVIVDVAIDQGGCIATSRETTHTDPVVTIHGVQHYAVGNMPGAVPFTSTEALVSVTLPYILAIAGRGLAEAITDRPELASGLNTIDGAVCHPGVAKALGVPSRHPMACLR